MSNFKPRLTAPSTTSKYWKHVNYGGVNSCIHISGGSCLPNCVGYAWGRFYETLGSAPKLSRANAENWYNYNDGYSRGKTPKLGAVICWRKGQAGNSNDGAGHVAIVEQILDNGDIVTSNSNYGGTRFYTKTFKKSDNYYLGKSYVFQGFIYNPAVKEDVKSSTTKSIDDLAKEVIAGKWGNGQERVNRLTQAGYNAKEIQDRVNSLLAPNTKAETTYVVKQGDTLSAIAKKYNTTWQKIYDKNKNIIGNNPNLIRVGQKLKI